MTFSQTEGLRAKLKIAKLQIKHNSEDLRLFAHCLALGLSLLPLCIMLQSCFTLSFIELFKHPWATYLAVPVVSITTGKIKAGRLTAEDAVL